MPCRNAVSPMSAQVLPYTESRLPSSRTTSTERRVVRASLASRAASRAACGVRTATRGRSRVRAKSATSWSATSAALLERDDPVGGPRGLLGVARGEQHGAALVGVGAQNPVQPAAFAGGEPVGRVVEDERVRVGQQRAGQAQPAVHAARERAQALVAQADEADDFEDVVGASQAGTPAAAQSMRS